MLVQFRSGYVSLFQVIQEITGCLVKACWVRPSQVR
jgi:hypothetical protein